MAEQTIDERGLAGLKARDLAAQAGCAVGAIYNVVSDLDDLVLAVNERTLAEIESELASTTAVSKDREIRNKAHAIGYLIGRGLGYLHFAATRTQRWRALFDRRLAEGKHLPEWYVARRQRMFVYVEHPLRVLRPHRAPEENSLLARSLFSAIHGVVLLGLEEKIGDVSIPGLEEQITLIINALGHGLSRPTK